MGRWKVTSGNRFPKVQAEPGRGPHSVLFWPLSLIPSPTLSTPTLPSLLSCTSLPLFWELCCSFPVCWTLCALGLTCAIASCWQHSWPQVNRPYLPSRVSLRIPCTGNACLPHSAPANCCSLRQSHRHLHSPGIHCRRNTSTLAKHSGSKQKYTLMYVHGVVEGTENPQTQLVTFLSEG